MPLRLEHLLTFVESPLEAHLESYRRAGFLPHARTARWNPGLDNGFVRFWPEYLEFLSIADEAAFAAGGARYHTLGGPDGHTVRQAGRPHGVGFYTGDVEALHQAWRSHGYDLPEVAFWRLKDTPPDAPPDFAHQKLPRAVLPGAACFALTSSYPDAPLRREAWVAPNSAFAVAGVSFVCDDPTARAAEWRDLLAPETALDTRDGGCELPLSPHRLTWLTPDAYRQLYRRPWQPAPHPHGELALVHLLAEDLTLLETTLANAEWQVGRLAEGTLYIVANTGVAFVVREESAEA